MTATSTVDQTPTENFSTYLVGPVRNGAGPEPGWSLIVDDAVKVWPALTFDTLLAIPHLRFEPFDYRLGGCAAGALWPTD